ncbi:unnamed protein product [Enterobius vermicularis]|uniref:Ovule protein n=1 Tax=Enterobius vermicularis TaxID=51028 RepID=A0A0N4VMM3_ENTVE|nr:unnamed protein product [Enterobius vermicularis]
MGLQLDRVWNVGDSLGRVYVCLSAFVCLCVCVSRVSERANRGKRRECTQLERWLPCVIVSVCLWVYVVCSYVCCVSYGCLFRIS